MKNSLRMKTLALAALLALTGFTSLNANAQVFGDLRPGVPGAGAPGGSDRGGGGGFDDRDRGGGRPGMGGGGFGGGGGRGADWDFCANEGQQCNVRGTYDLAYGANGQFVYRQNVDVRNGFKCENNTFGDPIKGVTKACWVKRSRGGGPGGPGGGGPGGGPGHGGGGPGHGGGGGGGFPPARWTYCAREGETCFVGRSAEVRYGANGRYNTLNVRNSIACNNNTFGDPVKGVAKICEYLVR